MRDASEAHQVPPGAWSAYGIRDAVVFAVGFGLALLLVLPFA